MTPKEIGDQLVAVHAALVEKTGGQPAMEPSLSIRQGGECSIHLYGPWVRSDYERLGTAKGATFKSCFAAAFRIIAAVPDADTAAKRKFHKNLADVIDEGNGLNLPAAVMAPLSEGMKAMSENLLTDQRPALVRVSARNGRP